MQQITWNQVDILIDKIIKKLQTKKFDLVYGHLRGGAIPAIVLSHKLDIEYLSHLDNVPSEKSILIVDDIIDRGWTLQKIKNQNRFYIEQNHVQYTYAALLVRKDSCEKPDVWGEMLLHTEFVWFPWETVESAQEVPQSWR